MKRTTWIGLTIVVGLFATLAAPGCATTDPSVVRDIEGLREEIRALRAEVAELKMASVKAEPRVIQLPAAAKKTPPAADLVLSILKDGKLVLGSEPVSSEELQERMKKLAAENPKARLVVSADKTIEYKRLVEVMDLVKSAGIQNLAIVAKEK